MEPVAGLGGTDMSLRRGWPLLCAGVLCAFLVLGVLSDALGGGPQGPASSSYATDSQGVAAWAQLLSRDGHAVQQLREPLDRARLDPRDTLVVLEPEALLHSEGSKLLAFVKAGGLLVTGGREPQGTLPALLPAPPPWTGSGAARELAVAGGGPTVAGVDAVSSAGEGSWTSSAGYRAPLRGPGEEALLLERGLGRGRLELLADASPLQNRLLASADDAQLALNLVGGRARPVVFVESVHGFGESRGLAALPGRWKLAFALLALAGLVWILAHARRLGAAEPAGQAPAPPRGDYTEAIALLLGRVKQPQELSAALERLRDGR
jgi:Domain of unknown function (DUF4350)